MATQSQILNANFDWLQVGKKEHFPEYKIQTQKTMFDRIAQAKRSTFDKSKFTVVGSPTITNDGIASGFSNTSFVKTTNVTIGDKTVLKGCFTVIGSPVQSRQIRLFDTTSKVSGSIYLAPNYIQTQIGGVWSGTIVTSKYKQNIPMYYTFTIENESFSCEFVQDGIVLGVLTGSGITGFTKGNNMYVEIGKTDLVDTYGNHTVDLKQFSIEVDGREVFSGNKTGIDQIKKDDYTVVGTPTISPDGIASGFISGRYLKTNLTASSKISISMDMIYQKPSDTTTWVYANLIQLLATDNTNKVTIVITTQNNRMQISSGTGYFVLQEDKKYKITVETDCVSYSKLLVDGVEVSTRSYTEDFTIKECLIGPLFSGSIDLNSFKVYVDVQLVYQPTLRIPYTQSKTGEKIVDAVYRDRVQDMYEQFGYTHYYTLDDNDYTLQTVPNEKIIDSYYADNSFMELTADLSLTQGGEAVSGQTINLKRPYKDNKYISTIGTSSKDTNSFVASASGQWITKGKGVLG